MAKPKPVAWFYEIAYSSHKRDANGEFIDWKPVLNARKPPRLMRKRNAVPVMSDELAAYEARCAEGLAAFNRRIKAGTATSDGDA